MAIASAPVASATCLGCSQASGHLVPRRETDSVCQRCRCSGDPVIRQGRRRPLINVAVGKAFALGLEVVSSFLNAFYTERYINGTKLVSVESYNKLLLEKIAEMKF